MESRPADASNALKEESVDGQLGAAVIFISVISGGSRSSRNRHCGHYCTSYLPGRHYVLLVLFPLSGRFITAS
jgi:hypothetical protein